MTEKNSANQLRRVLDALCAPDRPITRQEYSAQIEKIYGPIGPFVTDRLVALPALSTVDDLFLYADELLAAYPEPCRREAHLHSTVDGKSRLIWAMSGDLAQARKMISDSAPVVESAA